MKLSKIVARAKEIAHGNERRYPLAAACALREMLPNIRIEQTLRVTRGITIDYPDLPESLTLLQAIVTILGREGGAVTANRARMSRPPAYSES